MTSGENARALLLGAALLLFGAARRAESACAATQANCFAPARNHGPGARASASRTCGVGEHGGETYGFGGVVSGDAMPTSTAVCNGTATSHPAESHPAELFNDGLASTWWQAPFAVPDVSVQLDWPNGILLQSTTLTFRSIPPGALRLDFSRDNGSSWTPYHYAAIDCVGVFGMPETPTPPQGTGAICNNNGLVISTDSENRQTLTFDPTARLGSTRFTDASLIGQYLLITNLRVTFAGFNFIQTVLVTSPPLVRSSTHANRFYYGLYEWDVAATCNCFGHSNECAYQPGDVSGFPTGCNCSHNTAGDSCKECLPLFNNRTWLPGTDQASNECRQCECNNHADVCTFIKQTGPICNCMHFTRGLRCEQCEASYYRNASLPHTDPGSCVPCGCNPSYTTQQGSRQCDELTGQCPCVSGVAGRTCDRCATGFHSLTVGTGCSPCKCDGGGTVDGGICDAVTGVCPCKSNVVGPNCDSCKPGFFGPSSLAPLGGCYQCVCSNKTTTCQHSPGYRVATIVHNFPDTNLSGWNYRAAANPLTATMPYQGYGLVEFPNGTSVLVTGIHQTIDHADYNGVFVAPQTIVTNLNAAVGHRFSFGLRTRPDTGSGVMVVGSRPGGDVVISSSLPRVPSIVALLDKDPGYSVTEQYTMLLYPGQWRVGSMDGRNATLDDIMAVLSHATELTIRAVYYNNVAGSGTNTLLFNVSLEAASLSGDTSLMEARNVELCRCPDAYNGSDCGRCSSPTHSRNYHAQGIATPSVVDPFTTCTRCSCNAHSGSCDSLSGVCQACGDNTTGLHCETCEDTFFGDATSSSVGCQACLCNMTGSTNATCMKDTGSCTCKSNIVGRRCDSCQNGTYAFNSGTGCRACGCNVIGVPDRHCTGSDCACGQVGADLGVCPCRERVVGDKCTACVFGTQGVVPNCTVCHPCFDAWLATVAALRLKLSVENNRTLSTMQLAFGSMTPAEISLMLANVQTLLNQSRALLDSRREVQLDGHLVQLNSSLSQLTATLNSFTQEITNAETQLNASIDILASQEAFNGTIVAADGTPVSSESINSFSKQHGLLIQEIARNFSAEGNSLALITQEILDLAAHVNASRALTAAGEATARVAASTTDQSASSHAVFEAANLRNMASVQLLDQAIGVLEEDIQNASSLLIAADMVATAANDTAHMAHWLAAQQLRSAELVAADALRLSQLVNDTSEDANNVSDTVAALLATATATASSAQATLRDAESANTNFTAALDYLTRADQSASAALATNLPSIQLATNLSSHINNTIVPQSAVNLTLTNARQSLQEAEAILQVAQAAFDASALAYQMVSGIEAALLQHSTQHTTASQALSRARTAVQQTNTSLLASLALASQLSSTLTEGMAELTDIEDTLSAVAECQANVTRTAADSLSTARTDCSDLSGRANQTVSSAEVITSNVQVNATQQLGAARASQQSVQSASATAAVITEDVADPASIAMLKDLLSRYTALSQDVDAAQRDADAQATQLQAIVADLSAVSASCPAGMP